MANTVSVANARQLAPNDVGRKKFYDKLEPVDQLFPHIPFLPVTGEKYNTPRIAISQATLGGFAGARNVVWPSPSVSPADNLDTQGGINSYDPDMFTDSKDQFP